MDIGSNGCGTMVDYIIEVLARLKKIITIYYIAHRTNLVALQTI